MRAIGAIEGYGCGSRLDQSRPLSQIIIQPTSPAGIPLGLVHDGESWSLPSGERHERTRKAPRLGPDSTITTRAQPSIAIETHPEPATKLCETATKCAAGQMTTTTYCVHGLVIHDMWKLPVPEAQSEGKGGKFERGVLSIEEANESSPEVKLTMDESIVKHLEAQSTVVRSSHLTERTVAQTTAFMLNLHHVAT
ncbi:hypothetical protein CSIM01_07847 [Colletotrichum simmondsii]|uniref:Uncharacterized protein n=1 Tax=Colletotrichum simmondsii TaxID=703756 RepID=A0A135TV20_9PEZI|nr:hypothetical protein CSIM01_07847 [Colletotrichum simmondsii]